nr:phospholipase [Acidobacteriota bacterium]
MAGDYPLPLPNGLHLTFGQILSLGGDFFGYIVNGEAQEISDDTHPPTVFNNSFNALAHDSSAPATASRILSVMNTEAVALQQASTSGNQPSTAYADYDLDCQYNIATGGGCTSYHGYSVPYPEGTYMELAANNWDHFGPDAITAYTTGHGVAITQAVNAANLSDSASRLAGLQLAYAMDAFACHFLSDLFASGHMRTPRRQLYDDATPSEAGSMLSKYMHDEDNLFGLLVTNQENNKWKAFGDSRLFDTVDSNNLAYVSAAIYSSAHEVYLAFDSKRAPSSSSYIALELVANLSQFNNHNDHNNPPALFYYSGDDGYCREELTDLTNYDW